MNPLETEIQSELARMERRNTSHGIILNISCCSNLFLFMIPLSLCLTYLTLYLTRDNPVGQSAAAAITFGFGFIPFCLLFCYLNCIGDADCENDSNEKPSVVGYLGIILMFASSIPMGQAMEGFIFYKYSVIKVHVNSINDVNNYPEAHAFYFDDKPPSLLQEYSYVHRDYDHDSTNGKFGTRWNPNYVHCVPITSSLSTNEFWMVTDLPQLHLTHLKVAMRPNPDDQSFYESIHNLAQVYNGFPSIESTLLRNKSPDERLEWYTERMGLCGIIFGFGFFVYFFSVVVVLSTAFCSTFGVVAIPVLFILLITSVAILHMLPIEEMYYLAAFPAVFVAFIISFSYDTNKDDVVDSGTGCLIFSVLCITASVISFSGGVEGWHFYFYQVKSFNNAHFANMGTYYDQWTDTSTAVSMHFPTGSVDISSTLVQQTTYRYWKCTCDNSCCGVWVYVSHFGKAAKQYNQSQSFETALKRSIFVVDVNDFDQNSFKEVGQTIKPSRLGHLSYNIFKLTETHNLERPNRWYIMRNKDEDEKRKKYAIQMYVSLGIWIIGYLSLVLGFLCSR